MFPPRGRNAGLLVYVGFAASTGISTVHMGIGNVRRSRGIIRTPPQRGLSSAGCMLIAMKTYTAAHYDGHTSLFLPVSLVHCYAWKRAVCDLTRYRLLVVFPRCFRDPRVTTRILRVLNFSFVTLHNFSSGNKMCRNEF